MHLLLLISAIIWQSRCAYFALDPSKISQEDSRGGEENGASRLVRSHVALQPALEDVEIAENVPCCTNLFRSSAGAKEFNDPQNNGVGTGKNKKTVTAKSLAATRKNSMDNVSKLIERLEMELAQERRKVKMLKKRLDYVTKVRSKSYDYLDSCYDISQPDPILSKSGSPSSSYYQEFVLPDLIAQYFDNYDDEPSYDSFRRKIDNLKSKNYIDNTSEDDLSNSGMDFGHLKRNKINMNIATNKNSDRITKPLAKKNNVTYGHYFGGIPKPLKPSRKHNIGDTTSRTFQPICFIDDRNEIYNVEPDFKFDNDKLFEPDQIYVNNMRHLIEPYKNFPQTDIGRFINIRDRRHDTNYEPLPQLYENKNVSKIYNNKTLAKNILLKDTLEYMEDKNKLSSSNPNNEKNSVEIIEYQEHINTEKPIGDDINVISDEYYGKNDNISGKYRGKYTYMLKDRNDFPENSVNESCENITLLHKGQKVAVKTDTDGCANSQSNNETETDEKKNSWIERKCDGDEEKLNEKSYTSNVDVEFDDDLERHLTGELCHYVEKRQTDNETNKRKIKTTTKLTP